MSMNTRVLAAASALNVAVVAKALERVGLPPEVLVTKPEDPPKPRLVPGECPCGRTISRNKRFCLACAQKVENEILARRLASRIPDQDALDKLLEQAGGRRALVFEMIRPYLGFTPREEADMVGEE